MAGDHPGLPADFLPGVDALRPALSKSFGIPDDLFMVWFGSLVAVTMQTAYLSPPVAMSAYYLKQVVKDWSLLTIYKGMFEFMVLQCIAISGRHVRSEHRDLPAGSAPHRAAGHADRGDRRQREPPREDPLKAGQEQQEEEERRATSLEKDQLVEPEEVAGFLL
jgi:hypothetical protein